MPGPPEPKNASVDKNKQDKAAADKAAADKAAADKAAADKAKAATDNNKKDENKKKTEKGMGNDDNGEGGGDSGSLDEKGNPFPIKNEEGGDPTCPGGYKIDYQFDPINDPINPLFRCIPALKDPNDGVAGKLLAMANNPSGGLENLAMGANPMAGGVKRKRSHGRKPKRKPKRKTKRQSRRTRRRF